MLNKSFYFLFSVILVSCHEPTTQSSSHKTILQQIDESERAYALRTDSEKRLGSFYKIVRLAEDADTSAQKKKELEKWVEYDGRIKAVLELRDVSAITQVSSEIKSMGAVIERSGTYVPYIICFVFPKSLRQIIELDAVTRLRRPAQPISRPYNPNP